MSHIKENDFTVDVFLIFEEMQSVGGQGPPSARKDLSEFLNEHRKPFIMCYHVVAVNPTAQVYLVRDLHNTVHGRLLRPAIELFLNAVGSHMFTMGPLFQCTVIYSFAYEMDVLQHTYGHSNNLTSRYP
jgi:hypothetical protein